MIALQGFGFEAGVIPETGASLAYFRRRDKSRPELLRPTHGRVANPEQTACFPMLPFAGRIANGAFRFDGIAVTLDHNDGPRPNALHGFGWQARWTPVAVRPASVALVHEHPSGQWPWHYRARLCVALGKRGLAMSLSVRNLSDRPMPAGAGLHFYFPRTDATRLHAVTAAMTVNDALGLPVRACKAHPLCVDLAAGSALGVPVDNLFEGWNRRARIAMPGGHVDLHAGPSTPNLVIYAPANATYFCVEPVSHRIDGLNRRDSGMKRLRTNETLTVRTVLTPSV